MSYLTIDREKELILEKGLSDFEIIFMKETLTTVYKVKANKNFLAVTCTRANKDTSFKDNKITFHLIRKGNIAESQRLLKDCDFKLNLKCDSVEVQLFQLIHSFMD